MKISVIVPCYNSKNCIGAQLEALSQQAYQGLWELIISDNGSTDGTIDLVKTYKNRFPVLRIIDSSDKRGAGHARNMGAKFATGDVFLFCDSDDVVGAGWLNTMADALRDHEFVAGALEGKKLNSLNANKVRPVPQQNALQEYNYPNFMCHSAGANIGVHRYVHDSVGGFDETMMGLEDTDYCWKIQLSGVDIHFVKLAVVQYRFRNTLRESLLQSFLWGKYNVMIYKKYRQHGMPVLNWQIGINKWFKLFKYFIKIRHRIRFEKWLWQVAWNLGRIEGCLRYKVLAF